MAVVVIVLATMDWNAMRGPVSRYLSARLGREVHIAGNLDVHLFSWTPRVSAAGIRIAQPSWASAQAMDFADIGTFTASLDLGQLLRGHIVLPEMIVESPQVRLIRDEKGNANWSFGNGSSSNSKPFHLPPIRHFAILRGHLDANDAKRKLTFKGTISSEEAGQKSGQSFQIVGDGRLNGAPFNANVHGDPLLNVDPDKPYAFEMDVKAGATHAVAKGSLDRPFDLGAIQVDANFSGNDLADLYYLTGLALPNTPPYKMSGVLRRDGDKFRFQKVSGKIGNSDIAGEFLIDASGDKPYVRADLSSHRLDFADIGALTGTRVSSNATGAGTSAKAQPQARILPDAPLHADRLRQMNADVHYKADTVVSSTFPLRGAETKVALKDGVLKLDPVSFTFSKGTLNGTVAIDARKDIPVSDIDVKISNLQLEQFLPKSSGPPAIEGTGIARAKLHAPGISIREAAAHADGDVAVVIPHGQMRQAFAELLGINVTRALGLFITGNKSQTELRCALADFKARGGVMALQNFVFDTGVVQTVGQGNIDLRNERLNLSLSGKPKKPELIHLGAPITIGGTLAKPDIGVKAGKALAQGGLAALAAVINPVAAVLPFLDAGLAKDANCGALIQEAQAKGAPAKTVTR